MSMENPFLASVWCSEFILYVFPEPWWPDVTYRDQRSPALKDAAHGTSRRLLRTKWMGGMASTPQNTSRIDFLRMSLPYACRLYGSSLLKRAGEGSYHTSRYNINRDDFHRCTEEVNLIRILMHMIFMHIMHK